MLALGLMLVLALGSSWFLDGGGEEEGVGDVLLVRFRGMLVVNCIQ